RQSGTSCRRLWGTRDIVNRRIIRKEPCASLLESLPVGHCTLQRMNRFCKFFRLPLAEQALLVRAVTVLGAIRLGLWLLPFRMLKGVLSNSIKTTAVSSGKRDLLTERAVWAVQAATRYVPHATCLTQALAGQILLKLEGIPASVQI